MTRDELNKIFNSFNGKKVLLVGDSMIDAYMWGSINRISPEADVPVVDIEKYEIRLGGSNANCALNIKALGQNLFYVCRIRKRFKWRKIPTTYGRV